MGLRGFLLGICAVAMLIGCQLWSSQSPQRAVELRKQLGILPELAAPDYQRFLAAQPSASMLELGRQLFNDPVLSRNNDVSCATCHLSNHGFADGNSLPVGALGHGGPGGEDVGKGWGEGVLSLQRSLGDDGLGFNNHRLMFRNSLSTVNVFYRSLQGGGKGLLWDGRFDDLLFQILLPIHTPEEMCGANPVPASSPETYVYRAGGPLFKGPVTVNHSHSYDQVTGLDRGSFNSQPQKIDHIPQFRPNGTLTIPSRNECMAIALAKLRMVPGYRRLVKAAFNADRIEDTHVAQALVAFVVSHVSLDTPYDRFAAGDDSALTEKQMLGLLSFMKPLGESFNFGGKQFNGVGCHGCHAAPLFGGQGFASLGVISDRRSSLSRPQNLSHLNSGFFSRALTQRGKVPQCHVDGVSVAGDYAPDRGRADGSFAADDCFKFRIPPLRNVIETYPYFHHGSARAQGNPEVDFRRRSLAALRQVVAFHLSGPVDPGLVARKHLTRGYFDPLYQRDVLVPYYALDFPKGLQYPIELPKEQLEGLVDFIAYGLWDPNSVKRGAFVNDVSHPRHVLSGFFPSISRDHGSQLEIPPAAH